jgi:hypothetical protein
LYGIKLLRSDANYDQHQTEAQKASSREVLDFFISGNFEHKANVSEDDQERASRFRARLSEVVRRYISSDCTNDKELYFMDIPSTQASILLRRLETDALASLRYIEFVLAEASAHKGSLS